MTLLIFESNFLDELSKIAPPIALVILAASVIVVIETYMTNIRAKRKRERQRMEITQAIKDSFEQAQQDTENQAQVISKNKNVYNSFNEISKGYLSSLINNREDLFVYYSNNLIKEFESFAVFLESFKYWLLTSPEIENNGVIVDTDTIIRIKEFITEIYHEEIDKNLFEGVSQDERSSLLAISSYTRSSGKYDAIKRELNSLSNSMIDNRDRIRVESRNNRIAIAVSVSSLLATILLSLSTNSMLKKSMEKQENLFNKVDSISELIGAEPVTMNLEDSIDTTPKHIK